ncbi:type II secretion system protein GspG [Pyxidicoccus trucidator]|uniref:type II secretion system protein GspG n=1 Tax=Pyxidicoccus trucidator TaxID=2709662 RepID=UPI0013DCF1F2|nr:type II secretion system protein GspG [Pyxidicoccus trucidator]
MHDAPPRRSLSRALREAAKVLLLIAAGLVSLVLVGVPMLHIYWESGSRRDRADLDLRNIELACKLYGRQKGRLPGSEEGLGALVDAGVLEVLPVDPWEAPYIFSVAEDGHAEVSSLGADGKPGGDGSDADLVRRFKLQPP